MSEEAEVGVEEKVGESNAGSGDARSALRRRDRGKEEPWVVDFMKRAPYGFLATVGEGGQPYLNSNLFVYDEDKHCIYLHTHRTGRTRDNLEASEKVAFSVAVWMVPRSRGGVGATPLPPYPQPVGRKARMSTPSVTIRRRCMVRS